MTNSRPSFLPYGRQDIDETDIAAVAATLRSDWLTGGPAVDAFERAIEDATGAPNAVVCSSGTAALHLASLALDLGPGSAVVVPALTFAATANAVRYVGAEVVFCDVDPASGLATPDTIGAALKAAGPSVRALFVVHLNGQAADMNAIGALAQSRGLAVVEDACHAIGGTSQTISGPVRKIGSCSDGGLTAFSFHPVKTVTSAEGGALTCRDAAVADRLRRLRGHGITRDAGSFSQAEQAFDANGAPNPWYYEMEELGYNYRISDLQCALGLSQLRRLDDFIARRAELVERYDRIVAALAPLVRPIARSACGTPAWHLYPVLIDFEAAARSRAVVMTRLRGRGIGTQVHYLPVNRQPYYVRRYGRHVFPGADAYYARCLSLPLYPSMADSDVDHVVETLKDCLG